MNTMDLRILTRNAQYYRVNAQKSLVNNYMNEVELGELVDQRIIDAVLVDFINYLGSIQGVDFGLYTEDLLKL